MTGLLVFRTDARLFIANLLEVCLQRGHGLLVVQQVFHRLADLFHLSDDLRDTQVVVLAHEVGDDAIQLVIFLLNLWILHHRIGNNNGSVHLFLVVHAERCRLEPHHTTEILL